MIPPVPSAPIELVREPGPLRDCHPAYRALRPAFTEIDFFVRRIQLQLSEGYHLAAYRAPSGNVSAILGFRSFTTTAWGRILYIDDLSTLPEARRAGHATALLHYAEIVASNWHCDQLHLDSGHQRFDAHRLYHRHRYQIVCHHFARPVTLPPLSDSP